jgi:hypothetical protein
LANIEKAEADPTTGLLPVDPPPETMQGGYRPNLSHFLKQRHAETANKLAVALLVILSGTILVHYACVMILIFTGFAGPEDVARIVEDVFHSWLPVLSGLAGAAMTYYFTKDGK